MSSLFLDHSIPDLVRAVRAGELTFEDMARTTERVVAQRDAETLAWVDFSPARLLEESAEAWARFQQRGFALGLDGIPFGVKDIFNTREFPTQMGSPIWKGFTPGNNARVVDDLRNVGGLVAGKTVTAEFAVHALNETLNPHDLTRTPGTSSSGSVVAVASGMVPFALATQTAGSIVRPTSFCGVWGMKPSFGMIPRTGVLKTTDSLDSIGFVAGHAKSLRPLLDFTRVRGPDYPFVYRHVDGAGAQPKPADEPWRVGFVRTHTWDGAAEYARDAVVSLAERIGQEPDFDVEEIAWPELLHAAHEVHSLIYAKSLSYYFQSEAKSSSYISPIMSEMIAAGQEISTSQFQEALRKQEDIAQAVDELFTGYDFVISLGTSSIAPERGIEEIPDPSLIWTLSQLPSVAIPAFRGPGDLPFGTQFVSRRWNDYRLLQGIEQLADRGVLPAGSQPVLRWQ